MASIISEYLPVNKDMALEMLHHVEKIHKDTFFNVCLENHFKDADVMMGDYAIYPSWVHCKYPGRFKSCRLLYQRMGSDFYYTYASPSVICIFRDIWNLQMVSFEQWNIQKCVPALHIMVAYVRGVFGYYGRLPLTIPAFHEVDYLKSSKYFKRCRQMNRILSVFELYLLEQMACTVIVVNYSVYFNCLNHNSS